MILGSTETAAFLEHIMEHIALVLKKDATEVRIANFILPQATSILNQVKTSAQYDERVKAVETFNGVSLKNSNLSESVVNQGFSTSLWKLLRYFIVILAL